jgi:hypothetical protein
MRASIAALGLVGCVTTSEPELRIEPSALELEVSLDAAAAVPVRLFVDQDGVTTEVTGDAQWTLQGAELGRIDGKGFTSDGRTGGRARISATFGMMTASLPVHVTLTSQRADLAPPAATTWFAAAINLRTVVALEPGDGAVLPYNLGRLDIAFAAIDTDDFHEVTLRGPDLDVRVVVPAAPGPRQVELTAAEWNAVSRTSRGGTVELVVRSLRSADPTYARTTKALLSIADLGFPRTVLFTGRGTGEVMPKMFAYDLTSADVSPWMDTPATDCVGCHVAVSQDGTRIAAGGSINNVGGGVMFDAASKTLMTPPSAAIGTWTSAAFDPTGALVTSDQGTLTLRDGTTALPIASLTQDLPATQPAVANDGQSLAYVGGPIDPATTQPGAQELRIHSWHVASATLGAPRVLLPKLEGHFLKHPDFSSDDRWVIVTRATSGFQTAGSILVLPTDGSQVTPTEIATDGDFASFVSPIYSVHAGLDEPEPITWVLMKSDRPVGARSQADVGQLWAMAFYPERGTASRPFHLPGQRASVAVLHQPSVLP